MRENHQSEYNIHISDMPEETETQILKKVKALTNYNGMLLQDVIDKRNFGKGTIKPSNDELK